MDETATPMSQADAEESQCYEKAKARNQPTFTLVAQDVTAPVLVETWAYAQVFLKIRMDAGLTMQEAAAKLKERLLMLLGVDECIPAELLAGMPKLSGALARAEEMRRWPTHHVAD